MADKALITGVAGQDGTYLAEFLLERGYEVHGTDKDAARLAKAEEILTKGSGSGKLSLHLVDSGGFRNRVTSFAQHGQMRSTTWQLTRAWNSHLPIRWLPRTALPWEPPT